MALPLITKGLTLAQGTKSLAFKLPCSTRLASLKKMFWSLRIKFQRKPGHVCVCVTFVAQKMCIPMLDFADPQQKSRYNIKLVSRYSTCYCKLVWPEYYLASSARQVVRAMLVREVEIILNLSNCCLFRYMMVYMYRGPTDNHVRQASKIQFDLFSSSCDGY